MIKKHTKEHSVQLMCRVLSVPASSYYGWLKRPPSKRAVNNIALTAKIKDLFETEKRRSGAIRITKQLQADGESVGRNRVAKIMRLNGLRAKAAKKFKATTNSDHNLPVAPNLLKQNFEASRPNEKWVSDISVPQKAA
jgi:putative transposase